MAPPKHILKNLDLSAISVKLNADFIDVRERYPLSEDLMCKFTLNNYKAQDCDRIAIFKTGWNSLKEFILFEWVPTYQSDISYEVETCYVVFRKNDLPSHMKDADDYYQFCYISCDNVVYGVSTPFQVCSETTGKAFSVLIDPKEMSAQFQEIVLTKDKEIVRLREDNAILRESLKSLIDQRKFQRVKTYDDEIKGLKELTERLQSALLMQQKEIEGLKTELRRDRAERKNFELEKVIAEKTKEKVTKAAAGTKANGDLGNLNLDVKPIPPFPLSKRLMHLMGSFD